MPHGGRLPVLISRPAAIAAIIERVRHGVPLHTACTLEGVNPGTLHNWRQIHRGATSWPADDATISQEMREMVGKFFEDVALAEAEAVAERVELIRESARIPDKWGRFDWRADAWYLNNSPSTRDDWHEMRESHTEVAGTIRLQPVMQQLDTSDLEALALLPPPTPAQDDAPGSDA